MSEPVFDLTTVSETCALLISVLGQAIKKSGYEPSTVDLLVRTASDVRCIRDTIVKTLELDPTMATDRPSRADVLNDLANSMDEAGIGSFTPVEIRDFARCTSAK